MNAIRLGYLCCIFLFFKGKGDITNYGIHRGVKLLEHVMKIVENVHRIRMRKIVKMEDVKFGFMPGQDAIDAVFIFKRKEAEYLAKQKKLYMCFVDLEKSFDRVLRKVVEWAMRKEGIPEALVRAVLSLYEGAKTKVKVGTRLSG